jgi:hypothetical protein
VPTIGYAPFPDALVNVPKSRIEFVVPLNGCAQVESASPGTSLARDGAIVLTEIPIASKAMHAVRAIKSKILFLVFSAGTEDLQQQKMSIPGLSSCSTKSYRPMRIAEWSEANYGPLLRYVDGHGLGLCLT